MASGAKPEQWATRIGVILAVAGSAVGLGNFLRFPGQAAANGGGAFLLPYFIALLVLGIPLGWAEWTMGRYGGLRGFRSAPGIYNTIWRHPLARYLGAIALVIPLVIYMYYVLIEAWCLSYAFQYLTGDLTTGTGGEVDVRIAEAIQTAADAGKTLSAEEAATQAFGGYFAHVTGSDADGHAFSDTRPLWIFVIVGVFALNFFLIYRGVTKGIEMLCRFAMPLMAVLALIVLIRVLTLGAPIEGQPERNVINGLGSMWNPDAEALLKPQTWLAAAGQIFFSLSVGFGIIINYASYLKPKDDLALSGLTSSSVNEYFEVCMGGLITLPAAFIFLGVAATTYGTFGLGFNALPHVFDQMAGGRFFGFLWFFMLFLAAITSSVSMLQPVIAFLEEGFALKRHASATLLGLIAALGCGFVLYFSKGLVALDTFDFWIGTVLIGVLAMFQAFLYGWVFGIERGDRELHRGAHIRVPKFVQYMLKYVTPLYLVAIFIGFCFVNLPSKDEPAFETELLAAASLNQQELSDEIKAEFEKNKASLPGGASVSTVTDGERWEIRDGDGILAFTVNAAGGTLAVEKHTAGYIEQIGAKPVALMSLIFIAVVFAFLVLLVHIAGKRWEKEGRFAKIDAEQREEQR